MILEHLQITTSKKALSSIWFCVCQALDSGAMTPCTSLIVSLCRFNSELGDMYLVKHQEGFSVSVFASLKTKVLISVSLKNSSGWGQADSDLFPPPEMLKYAPRFTKNMLLYNYAIGKHENPQKQIQKNDTKIHPSIRTRTNQRFTLVTLCVCVCVCVQVGIKSMMSSLDTILLKATPLYFSNCRFSDVVVTLQGGNVTDSRGAKWRKWLAKQTQYS